MQPSDSDRSSLLKLLACLALILVVAGCTSPVLYWFGKGLLKTLHESGFSTYEQQKSSWLWSEITRADFPRFFNRAVLISALIILPFYLKRAGFNRELLPRIKPQGIDITHFLIGFGLAALLLLELGYLLVKREVYTVRDPAPWLALGSAIIPALSVAVIEEIVFRGFLVGMFLRSMASGAAAFWTTAIFALVHFLKPPEGLMAADASVAPGTGFWLIGQIFAHFGQMNFLLAEFFTLFAVGWVLVKARLATGQIWLSVGLHAGWVFGLKYYSALTRGSKPLRSGEYLPWSGENLRTGLIPCVIVLLTGWFAISVITLFKKGNTEKQA